MPELLTIIMLLAWFIATVTARKLDYSIAGSQLIAVVVTGFVGGLVALVMLVWPV